MRKPVVGDIVSYCMIKKMYAPVRATVTATPETDPELSGMQVKILVVGRKNQHPSGPIEYTDQQTNPRMGCWSWKA